MGKKLIVSAGDRYGKLVVKKEVDRIVIPSGQKHRAFLCQCYCGGIKTVRLLHLVRGRIRSCGCLSGVFHGETRSMLYTVWRGMKNRCTMEYPEKHLYWDRGITVCKEWNENYLTFKIWAINNQWRHGLQLDRINTDGNYCPENCRFVTPKVNCNNRRCTMKVMFHGKVQSFQLLLSELGLTDHEGAIRGRIARGWNDELAITTPIRKGNYRRNAKKENHVLLRST